MYLTHNSERSISQLVKSCLLQLDSHVYNDNHSTVLLELCALSHQHDNHLLVIHRVTCLSCCDLPTRHLSSSLLWQVAWLVVRQTGPTYLEHGTFPAFHELMTLGGYHTSQRTWCGCEVRSLLLLRSTFLWNCLRQVLKIIAHYHFLSYLWLQTLINKSLDKTMCDYAALNAALHNNRKKKKKKKTTNHLKNRRSDNQLHILVYREYSPSDCCLILEE